MVPGDSESKSLTQKLAEVWPRAGRGRRRHPRRRTVSDKIATRDQYISVHEAEEELQPQNRGRAIARVRGVGGSVVESMNAFGGRTVPFIGCAHSARRELQRAHQLEDTLVAAAKGLNINEQRARRVPERHGDFGPVVLRGLTSSSPVCSL